MVKARAAALSIAISGAALSAACAEPKAPASTEAAHADAAAPVGSAGQAASEPPRQAPSPAASVEETKGHESPSADAAITPLPTSAKLLVAKAS